MLASVSPYILEQFEKEVGYKFRPEFIIDQGYYNNQYRVPTKEFKDFQAFQRREVAKLVKEMVDITHELGKEAMMFLGDHWIGTEPFMDEFKTIGLDAVVGLCDDADVALLDGGDLAARGHGPVKEAKENWVTARRAILRKPIDRIGYGGYLKLALEFPEFIDYIESVCNEFRELYENIKGTAAQAIGHKEFFEFFIGDTSFEDSVERLKMQTRRYAKRQLTWFRKMKEIRTFFRFNLFAIKPYTT